MNIQTNAFLRLAAEAKQHIKEIPVTEVAGIPFAERPLLIDVREESEWLTGHAEGAVHLSRGIIEQRIHEIAPEIATPIVCYCGGGNRSALVAESLQKLGYTHVASLAGGLEAWRNAGEPVTEPIAHFV